MMRIVYLAFIRFLVSRVVLIFLSGLIGTNLLAQSGSIEDLDLYELIESSKEKFSEDQNISKAFAEVKSYYKDSQIELSQFFYNLKRQGFVIEDLKVKQSRVGIRPFSDIVYTSLNFAEKIFRYQDDEESWEMPNSPLRLSKRKLKRQYDLKLEKDYTAQGKSLIAITFTPKKSGKEYFSGRIWIDYTDKNIPRIEYRCENCKRTPFQRMKDFGVSMRVSMDISKEFKSNEKGMELSDMQFNYSIELLDDSNSSSENFVLEGNGKLVVYAPLDSFYIPRYSWFENELDNTFRSVVNPLDSSLWYGDEYKTLNPDHVADETFFAQTDVISNVYGNQTLSNSIGRMFNIPSIRWSQEGRSKFRNYVSRIVFSETSSYNFNGLDYLPVVHLYMNVNEAESGFDYYTSTIFDPVNSYFSLPEDTASVCFLSMFFDLTEIMRRKLEVRLSRANESFLSYEYIYNSFMYELSEMQNGFLDEVKEGTDEAAMKKWNDYIKQYLDVDNLLECKLYQDE